MAAYYNEIDPYAAQWLRNLIANGHIAPGEVDERSIADVHPDDLKEFTQCHFFAGIGVWSYALRKAGWPDDRRVWTGSCPCQPFSAAGEGAGFTDERHLWPDWFHLITHAGAPVVFGEQVASKDADPWIDLVSTDLEGLDYSVGAVAFPSASIGAPHIRDRLYWFGYQPSGMGDADYAGLEGYGRGHQAATGQRKAAFRSVATAGQPGRLADASGVRQSDGEEPGRAGEAAEGLRGEARQRQRVRIESVASRRAARGVADDNGVRLEPQASGELQGHAEQDAESRRRTGRMADAERLGREVAVQHAGRGAEAHGQREAGFAGVHGTPDPAGPTNGLWRTADWLLCRDGKWRPVEPGTFPLANGSSARVGRLRAYGNAINAEQAEIFIRAAMGAMTDMAL